jgi:hypothetical protein
MSSAAFAKAEALGLLECMAMALQVPDKAVLPRNLMKRVFETYDFNKPN